MNRDQSTATLSAHLLGSCEIIAAGRTLELTRRQTRALLYRLATELEPLARDHLCFLFWPDQPDPVARRNLTKLLSHLRSALPHPDLLIVSQEDVRIDSQHVWSDTAVFLQLCRLPPVIKTLQQAVNLYRGPFLASFALSDSPEFELWVGQQRRFFEQQQLHALAQLIEATATAQDYSAAIPYAQRYLAQDELAEEIHRRLIECYAASGDRGAALRQYEACVAILERELGVDPLPETRAAYLSALAYRPFPVPQTAPPLVWMTLPGLDTPLVGRTTVLAQLASQFTKVRQGHGSVVLITGEAGIGKSRLLQEFAQSVGAEALVLAGAHQPSEQTLPYHALTQALRRGIQLAGAILPVEAIWLAEASLLLPELRTLYPVLPPPLQTDPAQARTRLFEALCRLLLALAAEDQPLLLCLDDLHWADSATLDWLAYLGQQVRNQRVLVLGTYRREEMEQIATMRRVCQRLGILQEIELRRLTPQEIGLLLQQVDSSVADPGPLSRRLHQMTGGNAFFLLEILQTVVESGGSVQALADSQDLPLPQTVNETVMRRFRRLTPVAQQMMEASTVLGLEFDQELIIRTAGRSELETVDGLDELVKRHLLEEREGGYGFHHEITRHVIYQKLSHGRRRLLHRRAGETLEAVHQADLDLVSGQIALHYEEGGLPVRALHFYQRATTVARQLFAHQEALHHLQRATALLPMARAEQTLAVQLYEAQVDLLVLMGQHEQARTILETIDGLPGTLNVIWQARLKTKLAKTWSVKQAYEQALALYQTAEALLNAAPTPREPAWWQAWFAIQFARTDVYYFQARLVELGMLLDQLEEPVRQHGTLTQQMDYYHVRAQLRNRQERFRTSVETLALVQKIYDLAQQVDDQLLQAEKQFSYGFYLLWHGNLVMGIEHLAAALQRAEELSVISLQNRCLTYLTIAHRLQGDRVRTRHYHERNQRVAQIEQRPMYLGTTLANQAWLHWCNKEWEQTIQDGQAALQYWQTLIYPMQWLARWPLLAVALHQERLADAVHEAQAMLHPEQQQLPTALTTPLEAAVAAWAERHAVLTRTYLHQALQQAQATGYL
jgi:DNA-binding SARP family transcriptional activator